jgi:predicted amidohydrolase
MILASAQLNSKQGDIAANLIEHYKMIDLAFKNKVDLIVFPEMSLTGYTRENASDLAFTENDSRLDVLRQLSVDRRIILVVGAPVLINNDLYIGAFILKPDYSVSIYTKQYLHLGEEKFFKSAFDHNPKIVMDNEQISIAICSDIDNPLHVENAHKNGTTIYVASIFFTSDGISSAYKTLSEYAEQYGMKVLMSNFCGQSWGLNSGGQSGFWDKNGKLIANLDDTDSGLLIVENVNNTWIGKSVTSPSHT